MYKLTKTIAKEECGKTDTTVNKAADSKPTVLLLKGVVHFSKNFC